MIEYLIKSGFVLAIFLAFYRLWLEKEKMHTFNRFYLLLSLLLGLTIPLIEVTLPPTPITAPTSPFGIS